jgi:hypothetical protein
MKLTKGKPWKTAAKIVAYLLEISGTKEDARRAAHEWGVRMRIPTEGLGARENEIYAGLCGE